MKKGTWKIKSAQGDVFEFLPVFEVKEADNNGPGEVECKEIRVKVKDKDYSFNFTNLYQFIYFVANEELRQGLLQRITRKVFNLPYEVTFRLTDEEVRNKMAKRRIELPVDEVTMAIARNEAWKMMPQVTKHVATGGDPRSLFKGRK